jgi:hypothetical protein
MHDEQMNRIPLPIHRLIETTTVPNPIRSHASPPEQRAAFQSDAGLCGSMDPRSDRPIRAPDVMI